MTVGVKIIFNDGGICIFNSIFANNKDEAVTLATNKISAKQNITQYDIKQIFTYEESGKETLYERK